MSSQRPSDPLGHGQSEHTALKQEWLRRILTQQVNIVAGHQRTRGVGTFWYLDLFAGPGVDDSGKGSPLIALDVLTQSGARWDMRCWNKNVWHDMDLAQRLPSDRDGETIACLGDCEIEVPLWLRSLPRTVAEHMRGVCYVDPNGDVPWALLATIAAALPHVDILIHLSATLVKRLRNCGKIPRTTLLQEHIATVPKTHWLITPLDGAHQWTLLLASNWGKQPGIREIRFVPVTSEWGKEIFRRANYTREELRYMPIDGQMSLLGGK